MSSLQELIYQQPLLRFGHRPNEMSLDPDAAVASMGSATKSLPVGLEPVVQELRTSVIYLPLPTPGRLRHSANSVDIVVDSRIRSLRRRRFTIAHELGHLWLLRHRQTQLLGVERASEEHFCNAFAAALLLPRNTLLGIEELRKPSLGGLETLSHLAKTSLAAALIRLNEIRGWQRALLRCVRRGDQWSVVSTVNLPPRSVPDLGPDLHGMLDESLSTSELLQDKLFLGLRSPRRQCVAEVRASGRTGTVLLQF